MNTTNWHGVWRSTADFWLPAIGVLAVAVLSFIVWRIVTNNCRR